MNDKEEICRCGHADVFHGARVYGCVRGWGPGKTDGCPCARFAPGD